MKQADVKIGGHYIARVSMRFVVVRVDSEGRNSSNKKRYTAKNLLTSRDLTITAGRLRREATPKEIAQMGGRTMPTPVPVQGPVG